MNQDVFDAQKAVEEVLAIRDRILKAEGYTLESLTYGFDGPVVYICWVHPDYLELFKKEDPNESNYENFPSLAIIWV